MSPIQTAVKCDCESACSPGDLACPLCGKLVNADILQEIVNRAYAEEREGRRATALFHWKQTLLLVPVESPFRRDACSRIRELAR
jgi:hypothetical protein